MTITTMLTAFLIAAGITAVAIALWKTWREQAANVAEIARTLRMARQPAVAYAIVRSAPVRQPVPVRPMATRSPVRPAGDRLAPV